MCTLNNTEFLFSNFLKTAENVVTYYDDDKDKRNEILEKLQGIVKKNCVYDERMKKVTNTVNNLINSSDKNDTDKIIQMFKDQKDEMLNYKPDVSNNSNFIEYNHQVKELINNADGSSNTDLDDEDLIMTQKEINTIDPFTKKRMINPVKNKLCGHVYDRESVTSILQMNKNTKCPVVGCTSKDPIVMENLILDILTRKYLLNNPS